jgi:hypothetical protein
MTVKELKEKLEGIPDDTKINKWNTNYGWTELSKVKYTKFDDGTTSFDLE